ncbi:chloride channel protein [Shewanella surugensis]|uniref:Chloride channel protein n=1 Tax=Shewanella surugensis TaxID=212020 RepID=A0ABT0L625_9GAMM|nr:chloride channel protein [Shewanella surugensis]MCL1123138.1 chloride channel protein [Shewanella surugensis]
MPLSKQKQTITWRKNFKTNLKDTLSQAKVSVQLCLLALLFALIASTVIVIFRSLLAWLDSFTQTQKFNFTDLIDDWRVLLPILGAFLIWAIAQMGSKHYKRMGIAYVLHRVKLHYGKIPLASAPAQFFQALFALASQFSVGREGPAIHLGAVSASVLAEKFKLPDNSVRIMCASGIAAGIAAIFNAPLAAVIFVLEVILREYKIHYFFPITISAICGAVSSRLFFGNIHIFDQISVIKIPLSQYPILALSGLILGCVAAFFNFSLLTLTEKSHKWPLMKRLLIAGVITSLIGLFLPQAIGSNEHAISEAIQANPSILLLVAILIGKIFATVAAVGLGIPGGLIGPLYGIGALLGAAIALFFLEWFPSMAPFIGLYAIIGMTAMMGVCLSAPLAALVALIELSGNTAIILPSMFVIIPAFLISHQLFKTKSIFFRQLEIMGLGFKVTAVNLGLQKIGVRAIMNKNFVVIKNEDEHLLNALKEQKGHPILTYTKENNVEIIQLELHTSDTETTLLRKGVKGIADTCTLSEVYQLLSPLRRGNVFIFDHTSLDIVGVISWENLLLEIQSEQI